MGNPSQNLRKSQNHFRKLEKVLGKFLTDSIVIVGIPVISKRVVGGG